MEVPLATSENDLKEQLADLDWGTDKPVPTRSQADSDAASDTGLDTLDVSVAGVQPKARRARTTRSSGRGVRVVRGPKAQELVDAVVAGQTVESQTPRSRRSRTVQADVLLAAGEGPAIIALFDKMWRETGSALARSIGRSKASRQDAAVGWYMLLLAMRERDGNGQK